MNTSRLRIESFRYNEKGVTSIEYALLAVLIAVIIIASVAAVGDNVVSLFNSVVSALGA